MASSPAPQQAATLDAASLVVALNQTFASPSYRPPMLPGVAMEVMQLASRPEVKFQDVVKVLQQDPVLAARVLSIAQSAAYAARSPTLSLHQAAVRLGMKTLRELVVEAALHMKVFRVPGYDDVMARLYRHSTAAAHVSRAVCRRTLVNAEYAFLCGLLHDVGYAAALLAVVERRDWRRMSFDALAPVLDQVHTQVSGLLAQQWKLAEPIQRLVATHHQVVVDGRPQQANAALVVAEELCWEAGAGLLASPAAANGVADPAARPAVDASAAGVLEEARRALKLDDVALAALRQETAEIVAGLGAEAAPAKA